MGIQNPQIVAGKPADFPATPVTPLPLNTGGTAVVVSPTVPSLPTPAGFPSIVQNGATSVTTGTTLTFTTSQPVTKGNLLVACIPMTTLTSISIVDTGKNQWQAAEVVGSGSVAAAGGVLIATALSSGSITLTVTVGSSQTFGIEFYEITNAGRIVTPSPAAQTTAATTISANIAQWSLPGIIIGYIGVSSATAVLSVDNGTTSFQNLSLDNPTLTGGTTLLQFAGISGLLGAPGLTIDDTSGVHNVAIDSTVSVTGSIVAIVVQAADNVQGVVSLEAAIPTIGLSDAVTSTPPIFRGVTGSPTAAESGVAPVYMPTLGYVFNGTSWDRARNNSSTTTGDTGTKTATFNGATQTNFGNRGAVITILLATVSGTTPTLSAQLQWSPDGGTTWLSIGAALTNLTASNQTGTIWIYPSNMSTAGTSPAALTTGATQTLMLNAPLPRTWRLAYTLGGTTPSFAITSVLVNYIN